ncbi:MAG: cation:proton antiporter regulatory subunit [Acidimicrobiales bacterium]
MADVTETVLPGVGVRHEFTTDEGERVGVLVHRNGRREVLVYDHADPDSCSARIDLTTDDSRTLAELLGASQISEAVTAVQQQIEGLAIEWLDVDDGSSAVGTTIADGMYRTRTGASIVAVVRHDTSIPAPGPEFAFEGGDVVVAVGTTDGLSQLRALLRA